MKYLDATFKSVSDSGAFTAIASMPTLDRDKEVIVKGAFDPLPADVPVHANHDLTDAVGRARPRYDGDALLVDGWFGRSARAQEVRGMVVDGILRHVSVGFHDAEREMRGGIPHIVSGELLEVSLVSVPSNREAAVLSVRGYQPCPITAAEHLPFCKGLTDLWRVRLAALEAELALLGRSERESQRAAEPADVGQVLAEAKAFLAELARPATAPASPTVKASKAPPREVRCLYDVLANRNAKAFEDQAPAEPAPPTPHPIRHNGPSAYDLNAGRLRRDY